MTHFIENQVKSISLQDEPEIKLWYCEISSILKILFCTEKYHDFVHGDVMIRNRTMKKDDFSERFLSKLELKALNKFKSLKKQIEWLSGRFLLKSCLTLFLDNIEAMENIIVAYEKEGAPFLPDFPTVKISLSHSGNYAAVGVCIKKGVDIGIDIEQFKEKPDNNFLKTAFTQNEINSMEDNVEDILKKWTAKEAFLKYIKKGFNESLHRVEVIEEGIFHNQKKAQVSIFSEVIDGKYVLSLVTGRSIQL
ncbi:MAG: 4'-phosphopantetheinyl transferase superfamily protein [Desulfobacteraceae bacterium]|nr:4'-phosphopantetheinyl transferase superfamily protein [Desulfobacteraceae bacterium]